MVTQANMRECIAYGTIPTLAQHTDGPGQSLGLLMSAMICLVRVQNLC